MNNLPIHSPIRKTAIYLLDSLGEALFLGLLQEFYARQSQDVMIGFFFSGKDTRHIAYKQYLFIKLLSGRLDRSSKSQSVKSPARAHRDLPPILSGHFDRRKTILTQLLTEAQANGSLTVDQAHAWIDLEESFRAAVVS